MDSRIVMKNSNISKKLWKTHRTIIQLLIFLPFAVIIVSLLLKNSLSSHIQSDDDSLGFPLNSFIRKACPKTLYSSLCYSTLNTIPKSKNFTLLNVLEFAVNRTAKHVKGAEKQIRNHFDGQDLNPQEKNSLKDCMEMLDQTSYELEQVMTELGSFPSSTGRAKRRYGNIKTLLSAAMTNENTCINGFLDLEEKDLSSQQNHREHLQNILTPISRMISNSLALIKHVEGKNHQESVEKPNMVITKRPGKKRISNYARIVHRRKKHTIMSLTPHVTVASDGTGNYTTIGEAIAIAPNKSFGTYVIKIRAGVYKENVLIPREKINIMLMGEGMNSTIITGSRNFVDGFSTFASATLTVVGEKFLARDLTIQNTADPEKHQAVALRVTSNAAFYRCEIISHQDTLYAHSLRQFYHECSIQGTIDFIFGNAAAIFKNCMILVRKPVQGQSNMITAQAREDPNQNTGFILQNCTIKAATDFNLTLRQNFSTYLGRPWRNFSRTGYLNSYLDDLIQPQGWFKWDQYSTLDTVEYIEYMNSGHGTDGWLRSTVLPLFGSSCCTCKYSQLRREVAEKIMLLKLDA